MEWYLKAAQQNHAEAQNNIGVMYEKAEGIPQDYAQAMTWYLKAASNGNANAKKNIGNLYYYGKGVPQDYAKAKEWYESIKNTDIYLPE